MRWSSLPYVLAAAGIGLFLGGLILQHCLPGSSGCGSLSPLSRVGLVIMAIGLVAGFILEFIQQRRRRRTRSTAS
ncbi:MAG: hypothetical protein L3K14_10100 [Thermoplasmata archaeon]|nr:hypothetical protein [Thermoplasmata archaeon]